MIDYQTPSRVNPRGGVLRFRSAVIRLDSRLQDCQFDRMNSDLAASRAVIGDRVHMVWDYYDIPRGGIADFEGKLHIYKCQFSEAEDDWTDLFWLMEIDQRQFDLAKEREDIWLRWSAEFTAGRVSIDSHPALPGDRVRHDELTHRLTLKPERSTVRKARFLPNLEGESFVLWSLP